MKTLFSLPAIGMIAALGLAMPAVAQTASSQASEAAGATTGLGTSHRFPTADAAASHCPGDTVVWSNGGKLTYHLPQTPDYGHGKGFYACKMEADDAGFTAAGS